MVGRLLPFREKRMVGPFAFIDHMGPVQLAADEQFDVDPHPHIGLSTLTYLFDGTIMHRDSLGTAIEIRPGEVNWMTAGRGIVHSERTPENLRNQPKSMHGLQIWVALPKELEQMEPAFSHIESKDLPRWNKDGAAYTLIAGRAAGHESPVPVYSPLYLIEIKSTEQVSIQNTLELFGESGLYILQGNITAEGHEYGARQVLIASDGTLCSFTMAPDTIIYIFGGLPFPEERFIYWNFVASSRELIELAKQKWAAQEFPSIPGETGFVPLPPQR